MRLEILALVNNLSRYMQQSTCADCIFNFVYIFVGAFKVNAISWSVIFESDILNTEQVFNYIVF